MRASDVPTALALALALAGCGGGGSDAPPPDQGPAPLAAAYNVATCLNQVVTPGRTLANVVVPDTIRVDLNQPAGFPNGRRLTDPVIDITLAYLFIDVPRHGPLALANVPINPAANDVPFRSTFPYLAPPHGNVPGLTPAGSNFNFRTDPPSAYVQVDRMGMPAVATAVIGSSAKSPYNDDSPAIDATTKYVAEIGNTLTGLTNALADDFTRAGFTLCARPAG